MFLHFGCTSSPETEAMCDTGLLKLTCISQSGQCFPVVRVLG